MSGCALTLAACHDLTSVTAPDLVQPTDLNNPQGAVTLFNGAMRGFASAFGGVVDNEGPFVTASGLMADEFTTASSGIPGIPSLDQRVLTTGVHFHTYGPLQAAHLNNLPALRALTQFAPTERWRTGRLYANLGALETFFGEMYCAGVPLSDIVNSRPVYGDPLTTQQMLQLALAHFDSALVLGADSAQVTALAAVGKGRVLLDLNRYAEAAAAVHAVPTTFSASTEHSAAIEPNYLFTAITSGKYLTVADHEGQNGLNFVSAHDPRVPTVAAGIGLDGVTPVFAYAPASSEAAPIVVWSGVEARLIEAEAALAAGDDSWLTTLNALRATAITPAMPPLADPGSPSGRVDLLFRERAFWLFATGHRLGDLRRLVRQYGRSQDQVFPTGAYPGGLAYGSDVVVPVDGAEVVANPKLNGQACLDRNP